MRQASSPIAFVPAPAPATAEQQLDEARVERRRLRDQMNRAVEDERRRLAVDLHNLPLQELAGVGYQLERVSMALDRGDIDAATDMVDDASRELRRQIEAMRLIMTELRPPMLDQNGLAGALESAKARLRRDQPDLDLSIQSSGGRFDSAIETVFYRVAQTVLGFYRLGAGPISITIDAIGADASMTIDAAIAECVAQQNEAVASIQDRLAMIDGSVTFASPQATSTCPMTSIHCRAPLPQWERPA